MPQEYQLNSFEKGDFTDPHGNYWCTAAFAGVGEPVKWVVKVPSLIQIGQSYYGEIKEMMSKADRPYLRFYKLQRPEQTPNNSPSATQAAYPAKKEWQPRDDDAIRAQWAIGQAVQLSLATAQHDSDALENKAKELFQMVERVKSPSPPVQQQITAPKQVVDEVFDENEPIDLDSIPF